MHSRKYIFCSLTVQHVSPPLAPFLNKYIPDDLKSWLTSWCNDWSVTKTSWTPLIPTLSHGHLVNNSSVFHKCTDCSALLCYKLYLFRAIILCENESYKTSFGEMRSHFFKAIIWIQSMLLQNRYPMNSKFVTFITKLDITFLDSG